VAELRPASGWRMDTVLSQEQTAAGFIPCESQESRWYALYTVVRHEKAIADQIQNRGMEAYLPLYEEVHRWGQRRVKVQLPLFPGYLFVRLSLRERLRALTVPGVVRLVSFNGGPAPLLDDEIECLRMALAARRAEPHPYLKVGRRARIRYGPLAGLEGVILRRKNCLRLVLSIDLIMQSVAVEVDAADLTALT
jgi:transcription antitermination factor NusG